MKILEFGGVSSQGPESCIWNHRTNKTIAKEIKRPTKTHTTNKMFRNATVLLILASFLCFLYGIKNLFLEVEENACRMTYMFGVPQFSKVNIKDNSEFPHYGLFYYYEGRILQDVNRMKLKGAPVIFVPGNAGSYKQVRSLASVALRKGMDNDRGIHMDYFTVNFEEQLSALYGGYLENQKLFLRIAILAVRTLYKEANNVDKSIILVGHSMGGKVAQAVIQDPAIAKYINTIIFISSPIDKPVVNFDPKINEFYSNTDGYFHNKRTTHLPNRQTNVCLNYQDKIPHQGNESKILDNILMISMGGGNRDLLVRDGLTTSQYNDIHAMTSSIPKVWLSCDHLSAVWCLQLVLVINRFIFGISVIDENKNVFFSPDKYYRTQTAINYFVKPLNKPKSNEVYFPKLNSGSSWQEDSKIAFRKVFKNGLRADYNHLLPTAKYKELKKIYIEIDSYEDFENDWVFGCTAHRTEASGLYCQKGTSLSHFVQTIPSHDNYRYMVLLDIHRMLKYYPDWTHILVRLKPTNKPTSLKIDAYSVEDRKYKIKAPKFSLPKLKTLVNETVMGTIHTGVLIEGLDEPFPTVQFDIEPVECGDDEFGVTAKICIPWARGFNRHIHLTHDTKVKTIYVNVPFSTPSGYNTTQNPVTLDLFLNPSCRYKISYQFSIAGTFSKIVQEFYHWLPAHLTAVLFLVLRNQIVSFQNSEDALFVKPYAGFFQSKSLYIVTGCRLLKKLLLNLKFLPISPDTSNYSFYVSIIIHGTAIVLSIVSVFSIWTILTFHGNILHKIALKLTRLSTASSEILMKVVTTLPLSFGVLFISISVGTCSGIGLTLATIFYFLVISNAYKDYLENWAWDKAKGIFKRIRQKIRSTSKNKGTVALSQREIIAVDGNPGQELIPNNENGDTNELDDSNEVANEEKCSYFEGLENVAFHITMLMLLGIMSALNFGLSVAWIKAKYQGHIHEHLPDPFIIPTIITLTCLSVLLQLGAPRKSSGYHYVAIILYLCVCGCILFCQEIVYRLSYLITFVYVCVALQEVCYNFYTLMHK
ncbi:GPI inositol-deacylase-like isoform X1 [Musca domestica]|uniref:GPI inositol-deacylase n=3 Tax=Musca domestica TaxID=7370 RepID=A0ABM3VD08_MUSDO|nr:GPI inositol-deacylase-like isoform X1 [Musca domestica]